MPYRHKQKRGFRKHGPQIWDDKNAILDGCSTVDSKLDYDGIGWYLMVLHGIRWYFAIE